MAALALVFWLLVFWLAGPLVAVGLFVGVALLAVAASCASTH